MATNTSHTESTGKGFKFFMLLLFAAIAIGGYMLLSNLSLCESDTSITLPDGNKDYSSSGSSDGGFTLSYDGSVTCSVEEMMYRALGDFKGIFEDNGYKYELYENGAVIVGCTLTDETVEIPSELGGKSVVCIGEFGMYESSSLSYTTRRTAFRGNSYIKKLVVPDSVLVTGTYCFAEMACLEELVLPKTLKYYFASAISTPWYGSQSDEFCTVGDGILIKYNGVGGDVAIPEGVKVISQWALTSNPLYSLTVPTIESVTLPSTLTYISDDAIELGTNVISLTIPDSVRYLGDNAIDLSASAYTIAVLDIGSGIRGANEKSFGFESVWPSAIAALNEDYVVIGDGVLIKCNAQSVSEIPSNVRAVSCKLPCEGNIKIPASVQYIGGNAFSSASEVTLSEGLQMLGVMAFNNSSIKSVSLPSSVWYIGVGAFSNCTSMSTANLNSVKIISPLAFHNTAVLGSIQLGSRVSYIGKMAFSMSGISELTLPESVKLIDDDTFYGCSFLEKVNISAMDTTLGDSVFGSSNTILYCPKGSKSHIQAENSGIKFIAE